MDMEDLDSSKDFCGTSIERVADDGPRPLAIEFQQQCQTFLLQSSFKT
jgi:hypothetical protein